MAETYFKTTFKGYDTKQVDDFIIMLSDKYEQNEKDFVDEIRSISSENKKLQEEIDRLNKEIQETEKSYSQKLQDKQAEYDALCAEIGERMVVADKRASEIIKNAEKEADLIMETARQNSENQAKMIRIQAEEEASKIIEETQKKCDDISKAAEEFRQRQNEMNKSIYETEKRFGDALSRLRQGFGNEV